MRTKKEIKEDVDFQIRYSGKLWRAFQRWKMKDKIAEELSFHLAELAYFSPKYKKLIDVMMRKKTEKEFIEALSDIESELFLKHEVEFHMVPAQKLIGAFIKKAEDR
jgi:hypothetical protein